MNLRKNGLHRPCQSRLGPPSSVRRGRVAVNRAGLVLALAGGIGVWSPALAAGPSFHCAKASSAIEKAICRFPWLAEKDLALANAYKKKMAAASTEEKNEVKSEQREWMKQRNKDCERLPVLGEEERYQSGGKDITVCLSKAYESRIKDLETSASKYGKWRIYRGEGKAYARVIATKRRVPIFEDASIGGEALGGASTENTDHYKILEIKAPFITYLNTQFSRRGAFGSYAFAVRVFDLESEKDTSLTALFDQKEILQELAKSCGKTFGCGAVPTLATFAPENVKCPGGEPHDSARDILDGFTLDRMVGADKIHVTLVFHNPCIAEPERFQPMEAPLTLSAPARLVESLNANAR